MMDITFQDGDVQSIWFPPGSEFSCEFSTTKCAKECDLVPNIQEHYTIKAFEDKNSDVLIDEIRKEISKERYQHLYWFSAGDCPQRLTKKVARVMKGLSKHLNQNGFTRNKELWESAIDLENTRLVYSTDSEEIAKKLSKRGLTGFPKYGTSEVRIYIDEAVRWSCGGGTMGGCGYGISYEEGYQFQEVFPEECPQCEANNRGCFT